MTAHGGTNPNASCSRLVSRMVISSALAPARLSLAPCSPPSRTLRAASRWPAAILDRSCAQRLRELRPGRRNGSQPNRETPDQPRDWLSLPTPNSEEALFSVIRPLGRLDAPNALALPGSGRVDYTLACVSDEVRP